MANGDTHQPIDIDYPPRGLVLVQTSYDDHPLIVDWCDSVTEHRCP